MTPSELLALLGQAWSRLLLYPGGLAAIGFMWLLALAERHEANIHQDMLFSAERTGGGHKDTKTPRRELRLSAAFESLRLLAFAFNAFHSPVTARWMPFLTTESRFWLQN